jgi:hypothetical protein
MDDSVIEHNSKNIDLIYIKDTNCLLATYSSTTELEEVRLVERWCTGYNVYYHGFQFLIYFGDFTEEWITCLERFIDRNG